MPRKNGLQNINSDFTWVLRQQVKFYFLFFSFLFSLESSLINSKDIGVKTHARVKKT